MRLMAAFFAAALIGPAPHTAIADQLVDAQRLLVRFSPFGESPVTAEFDISHLADVIDPLRQSCHW